MSLSQRRFSDLIGSIYDCAIDPERWPATIEQICRELCCMGGNIMVIDFLPRQLSWAAKWNFSPDVTEDHHNAILKWWEFAIPFLLNRPLDRPFASSRFDPFALLGGRTAVYSEQSPTFARLAKMGLQYQRHRTVAAMRRFIGAGIDQAWGNSEIVNAALAERESPADVLAALAAGARRTGMGDVLSTVVLRTGSRIGIFNADRERSQGLASDEDLEVLAMLAPHIRRSITISDLLDLKVVEAHALGTTLDQFALGIIVVGADQRILHANEAAKAMICAGSPIQSRQGRLHVSEAADKQLAVSVAHAENEADIGKLGIGISLKSSNGVPALAHVLPLAAGEVRSRLVPQAVAAVFITQPGKSAPADLAAFGETFLLTAAEIRVLQQLVQGGGTMQDVANALSVSEATAKTHLSRILAKTGVGRQAELITLVRDLVPPLAVGRPQE